MEENRGGGGMDSSGLWLEVTQPCIKCGLSCDRLDINFEAPVHVGPCLYSVWKEYLEALYGTKFDG